MKLTDQSWKKINIFLKSFCNNFPETRVIIAASPDYLDGLIEIDFTPVSMAAWGLIGNRTIHPYLAQKLGFINCV